MAGFLFDDSTDTMNDVSAGIGTSLMFFPSTPIMGVESGRIALVAVLFKLMRNCGTRSRTGAPTFDKQ